MIEEPTENPDTETVGPAPTVPKPIREPLVIDGDATDLSPKEPAPPESGSEATLEGAALEDAQEKAAQDESEHRAPGETAPEAEPEPKAAPDFDAREAAAAPVAARRRGGAFGFGLLGAVVGAGAALAAAWVYDPRADALNGLEARQRELQSASSALAAGVKTDESRLAALEAAQAGAGKSAALDALDKRLGKLEASVVKPDAMLALQSEIRAAHAAADKALAAANGAAGGTIVAPPTPDPRIDKLESEEAALVERIGKLEAALSAPKSEARVAASDVSAGADPAAQAVAALALDERLRSGRSYGAEWSALSRMGADAAALAALKPFAESGAPTPAVLSMQFAKLATGFAGPASPEAAGVMDRLLDHMRKLVKVRPVGEVAGEDPAALATQIIAALARGDIGASLATYGKLPEPARAASADWAKSANAVAGAETAARGLRENAIANLAAAKK